MRRSTIDIVLVSLVSLVAIIAYIEGFPSNTIARGWFTSLLVISAISYHLRSKSSERDR